MKPGGGKKIAIVGAILLLLLLVKLLGLDQYLTLSFLKAQLARFTALYAANPLTVLGVYALIYILVTALSLPGAAVMTLAGGGLFGLVTGTIVVSFASSIGATCACLVARYLLRDWVQNRFGDKLTKINEGMAREGGFYLFSLRLVPIFPFFIINLGMGLTPIRMTTFYWVSQVGMLPATIVFVNAGRELARLESISGILSPGLILSFALLGLLPLTAKKLLNLYRARRGQHQ
jgi:uncharacterized membrane protein YdjX (TVP38/TMEM64 family)